VCILALLLPGVLIAQEETFSFIVKGNLTTGSRLFPNPTAADPVARSESILFEDFWGLGVEVKFQFPGSSISLGLSTDYIRSHQSSPVTASRRTVPGEDGFVVVPVELTGYFRIPVTDGPFGVFMGGGGGFYFGRRDLSIAGVAAVSGEGKHGYGIHVLGGVSYRLTPLVTITAEMKFRDAHFEAVNTYPVTRIPYRDVVVNVSRTPMTSSIHTDGMVLQLGVAFTF
jgi:opacity protein-like surface antigen